MKKVILAGMLSVSPLCAVEVKPKALILDLGGIFIYFSKFGYAKELGLGSIISYMLCDLKNPAGMKDIIFGVLEQVPLEVDHELIPTRSPNGDVLPYILNTYQTGRVSPKEALSLALKTYERLNDEGYFVSEREADLTRRALIAMFDPVIHAKFSYPIKEGIKLLKELKAQNKYLLLGLTNWDGHSFEIVQQTYPEALEAFDEIFVSGNVGRLKPNEDAFEAVLEKYNLIKEECVFLDDQPENIEAARQLGIPSVLFKNYYQARKELYDLGILPEEPTGFSPSQRKVALISALLGISCLGYYFLR